MAMSGGKDDGSPMMEMNTTPLIDVMLVLLIMFIITIPVATHAVNIDLPQSSNPPPAATIDPVKNKLVLTSGNQILWNGTPINQGQLVTLLQGTKAYGAHVEPVPVPARERWPRHPHANFYWLQEDYLRGCRQGADWALTILRPQVIFGESLGSAMNPIPALGVYAAILKDEGRPLAFPGGARRIFQAVDADLLARVCAWAAESPAARDETFNVNNGEEFEWATVWPAIAEAFGMAVGAPAPMSLAEEMPRRQAQWSAIHRRHGLRSPESLRDFVGLSFQYADRNFGFGTTEAAMPALVSTVKLRQAGFQDCVDTEEMFVRLIRRYQALRWLPG